MITIYYQVKTQNHSKKKKRKKKKRRLRHKISLGVTKIFSFFILKKYYFPSSSIAGKVSAKNLRIYRGKKKMPDSFF